MKKRTKWTRIIYLAGVIALIAGALDPLEGSIVIAVGSALISLSTWLTHDRHRAIFLASLILIVTGVCCMFYFSSLGGFGGKSTLSWWWATLLLPYPVGWLLSIIILITRAVNKTRLPVIR